MTCKYCDCTSFYEVFVPFRNPSYKIASDPKWAFHIASVCTNCHKHQKFLKQTDELLHKLDHAIIMPGFHLQEREIPKEK